MGIKRVFAEKRKGFDIKALKLYNDLKHNLGIDNLESVRVLIRYDVEGISQEEYDQALNAVFSEPPVDEIYEGSFELNQNTL